MTNLHISPRGRALGLAAGLCLIGATLAQAGSGGTEFDSLYTLIEGWMKGTLGKLIAIVMVAVGIGVGVLRGSILGAVSGIAGGVAMFYAPDIIGGIVTATLPIPSPI